MNINYDASWTGMGGIGRFSQEVVKRLSCGRVFKIKKPASFFAPFRLRRHLMQGMITFFPGYIPPFLKSGMFVFTIHDLNHIDRSENSSFLKKVFYNIFVRHGCRKAYKVLTVSEFSRGRIIEWSGISPGKVVNVGNGVDENFNPLVAEYDLGSPYFLCVGNRKAHKNEARVVEAFASASLDERVKLVFTGAAEPFLEVLVEKYNLTSRVEFMGNVSEKTLPSLYKGARGLLFPSLYEGFGLPVLEAMACGTPVVTSNVTSLPEVAGDAAILINPTNTDELRTAIERLENDPQLRNELITKGYERVKLFTWEKTAQRVKEVLDSAQQSSQRK